MVQGVLTLPLSEISEFVSGLDISHIMLDIAKKQPNGEDVKWIEKDVDTYKFKESYYDLIMSYESLHLFPNTQKLLQRCSNALKDGGILCMGWCIYNWEMLLEREIVSIFNNHGVIWGEWSYQKFNKFQELIDSSKIIGLSSTKSAFIEIYQEWEVAEIVKYITSISKALSFSKMEYTVIQTELMNTIKQRYGNIIKGKTQFWIRYSQKR